MRKTRQTKRVVRQRHGETESQLKSSSSHTLLGRLNYQHLVRVVLVLAGTVINLCHASVSSQNGRPVSVFRPDWSIDDEFGDYSEDELDQSPIPEGEAFQPHPMGIHKPHRQHAAEPRFFNIDVPEEWKNYGTWIDTDGDGVAVNDTCYRFHMCSNQETFDGGMCMQMVNAYYCIGCDPLTGICQEYKHVRVRKYKETATRQQWVWNAESKQLSTVKTPNDCLTLMAVDNVTFPDLGTDPCAEVYMENYLYGGGYVYNRPCLDPQEVIDNGYVWQQWEFEDGRLVSECPHRHAVADLFPFMGVAAEDKMPGGVFNYRYGTEIEITKKLKGGAGKEILNYFLNDTHYGQVLTHGCWCAALNGQDDPFEDSWSGPAVTDELDFICKRWLMARKCIEHRHGDCYNEGMDGVYTMSFDYEDCPWIPSHSCGAVEGHLNDEPCCKAACEIDDHYTQVIMEYLEGNPDWEGSSKTRAQCKCPECVSPRFDRPDTEKCCVGDLPNVFLIECHLADGTNPFDDIDVLRKRRSLQMTHFDVGYGPSREDLESL